MIFNDCQHQRVRSGVTLIEVIMVIIVLAASAMVIPFAFDAQWNAQRQLTADASHLRQSLRVIRDTAILHQVDVTATYDGRGEKQLLIRQSATPTTAAKDWEVWLDTDSDLRWSNTSITFNANGFADRNLEVRLAKDRSRADVRVSVTGQIQ